MIKTLLKIAQALGPRALEALVSLAKMAVDGSSAEAIAKQAAKVAHVVAYEKALAARRAGKI